MNDRIYIFDTTLRDGAQTPWIGMGFWDRFIIAKALADIGVDVIELGFAANHVDYEMIKKMAKYICNPEYSTNRTVPVACSLARAVKEDVRKAFETIEPAPPEKRRIHVFIGTSQELMDYSIGKKQEVVLSMIRENVSYARELIGDIGDVEYSSEDALRTDLDFLLETIQSAVDCGASVINVPDTTGFARPDEYYDRIIAIRKNVKGIENVLLSAHIHHDSGNSVATTLKGIEAGIRQVEGTVLQLGERTGNVDWMSVVTNLNILKDFYKVDVSHIDTTKFFDVSRLVASIIEHPIPLVHPVTGRAAFAESSGIHVKGILREPKTYFVIPAATVGREVEIVLGQTSGTNTVADFLRKHGYTDFTEELVEKITEAVKEYSTEIKDGLTQTEALLFVEHFMNDRPMENRITLKDFQSSNSLNGPAKINVSIVVDGSEKTGYGEGVGPIDAFMNAMRNILNMKDAKLQLWKEHAAYHGRGAPGFEIINEMKFSPEELELIGNNTISAGQEALAKSVVEIEYHGKTYSGRGVELDITKASYLAIVNAFDAIFRLNNISY
nr:hypothetical protein [Desulfobacterales bacterium]